MTRAATWTAIPPTSAPLGCTSPVCRPARISTPSSRSRSRSAVAQRIAAPGLSKVARMPSPVDFTSRPPDRSTSSFAARSCASRSTLHCRSPIRLARSVDPTMSVNRTVASVRSPRAAGTGGRGRSGRVRRASATAAWTPSGSPKKSIVQPGQKSGWVTCETRDLSRNQMARNAAFRTTYRPACSTSQRVVRSRRSTWVPFRLASSRPIPAESGRRDQGEAGGRAEPEPPRDCYDDPHRRSPTGIRPSSRLAHRAPTHSCRSKTRPPRPVDPGGGGRKERQAAWVMPRMWSALPPGPIAWTRRCDNDASSRP